ncbi:hypothetical protein PRUPE_7G180500 [Prunus persica]|uniref:Uncharacterized protein n=1 Tax=Prunus persica TaxID=3760 RepID=A0A251NF46_PRUPE|nr:hypothetical protein PRUPE_7G180500 [Prunus persica]
MLQDQRLLFSQYSYFRNLRSEDCREFFPRKLAAPANQLLPSRFKGGDAIIVNLVFFCNVEPLFINNVQKM